MNEVKYEQDFYGWTQQQARLLRESRFAELDVANIVEEIETLGRSESCPWSFDQAITDDFWPE